MEQNPYQSPQVRHAQEQEARRLSPAAAAIVSVVVGALAGAAYMLLLCWLRAWHLIGG